jgi:glycosyltransferase involved in cell wall biosynthesis
MTHSLADAGDPGLACPSEVGKKPAFALVIPALNEAATIRDVVTRAMGRVDTVIVVDDGSHDGTAQALKGVQAVILRNARTCGKAASLRRGIAYALDEGVSAVITLDGDGQHAPEDIPRLIAAYRQNPRMIVIGARLHDTRRIPRSRYLANRFANFWIAWAAGYRLDDSQSGFRLYPARVLESLRVVHNRSRGFVFESEILIDAARAGVKSVSVTIPAVYRKDARASHFRPILDVLLITRMVAWKLLSRGLYLTGLVKSLQRPDRRCHADNIPSSGDSHISTPLRPELTGTSGVDYSEVSNSAERG